MRIRLLVFVACLLAAPLAAEEAVNIRPDLRSVTVQTPSGPVVIERIQDKTFKLSGEWALTSRDCPPFCIQPQTPVEGVATIGELELLDMLVTGSATVIDSRTPEWFAGGTIPGAVNIPYTQILDQLGDLGCVADFEGWNCSEARPVALFCNGLWCGQSPTAIRNMIEAGYPAGRISYYRGGMQTWRLLGLTVAGPDGGPDPAAAGAPASDLQKAAADAQTGG